VSNLTDASSRRLIKVKKHLTAYSFLINAQTQPLTHGLSVYGKEDGRRDLTAASSIPGSDDSVLALFSSYWLYLLISVSIISTSLSWIR